MASHGVRVIDDGDLQEWFNITRVAMLSPTEGEESLSERRKKLELDRCIAATDSAGTICGGAAAFSTELSVPSGLVSAAAITAVGVLPTHRRQGHLRRLMQHQLADVHDRREPVAVLIAAEYPIYARYGYGPATEACLVRIDAGRLSAQGDDAWVRPSSEGQLELVDGESFVAALPKIYERARRRTPGHLAWRDYEYRSFAGLAPMPAYAADARTAMKVVWRDASGEPQGAAVYHVDDHWDANRPAGKLAVNPLVAATDEAQRELVRYLVNVDWITTVDLQLRPIDDPTPLWLRDGRNALLVDRSDHIWARILDVPAALTARRYSAPGRLVIEVTDPMGFANGRFLLEADGDGADSAGVPATCGPTDASPDVTVPVTSLGSAYLGGFSWGRLAAAGQADEHRPGAVALASSMFTTPRAPWCARTF